MSARHWESYFDAVKGQDWAGALRVLGELVKSDGGNPQVHLKRGDAFQRSGDTVNAVASYHEAARLLADRGFSQKAIALYKIILRLAPYDMEAMDRSRELLASAEAHGLPALQSAPGPDAGVAADDRTAAAESSQDNPEDWLQATAHTDQPAAPSAGNPPSLFSGMTEKDYREMVSELPVISYAHAQKVIEEGDSGDSLYIIRAGRARVQAHILGKELQLALLREGDVFGEVSFLTGRPRTADVIASGPLEVYEVSRRVVEAVIERNPAVLSRLHEFFESRVRDTIRKAK